jgi:hypothetical protein
MKIAQHSSHGFRCWLDQLDRVYRGGDGFALVLGGLSGLLTGLFLLPLIPSQADFLLQYLPELLLDQLPVWMIACFLILRLAFLMQSDTDYLQTLTESPFALLTHTLACIVASLHAWIIFFLSTVLGLWVGIYTSDSAQYRTFIETVINFDRMAFLVSALKMALLSVLLSLSSWFELIWVDHSRRKINQHDASKAIIRSVMLGALILFSIELLAMWLAHYL